MAKFQLCEFRRNNNVPLKPCKADNPWERGMAKVSEFGDSDVEFIIDEKGKRVKPTRYRLLGAYAHTTLDTEADSTFVV